jgi:hypothetical protein
MLTGDRQILRFESFPPVLAGPIICSRFLYFVPRCAYSGTTGGIWIVTGVRAHQERDRHNGYFVPASDFVRWINPDH